MSDAVLTTLRDLIQQDPGQRGLARIPGDNLLTLCAADFVAACRCIADHPRPRLAVVTGFFIPTAEPPAGETDGPPGALFLARALVPLGIEVALASDPFCIAALEAGLRACGMHDAVRLVEVPSASEAMSEHEYCARVHQQLGFPTHLVSLERVGPTHTPSTLQASGASAEQQACYQSSVAPEYRGRCHTMRARDITTLLRPAHLLFENRIAGSEKGVGTLLCEAPSGPFRQKGPDPFFAAGTTTIGIGDGGNEIGMGKIAWDVIRRNIPRGELVACRVPTDHLIVCGVSNWGGYALAAGVRLLRGAPFDAALYDPEYEEALLRVMVETGPLVDGVTGRPAVTVDGLPFALHAGLLRRIGEIIRG